MTDTMVLIALGSNRRHGRIGAPRAVIAAAVAALPGVGLTVEACSRLYRTDAVGPPQPAYVNAALRVRTQLSLPEVMQALHQVERLLGRRRQRRWAARVIDLDLIGFGHALFPSRLGWRGGRGLKVPHEQTHRRAFVLTPLADVAPLWRHPVLGLSIRQLEARQRSSKAVRRFGRLQP